jgi:hypothetical protein
MLAWRFILDTPASASVRMLLGIRPLLVFATRPPSPQRLLPLTISYLRHLDQLLQWAG